MARRNDEVRSLPRWSNSPPSPDRLPRDHRYRIVPRAGLRELSSRVDLTLTNPSNLKTGRARAIRFPMLEAICEAPACQPGGILGYVPNDEVSG